MDPMSEKQLDYEEDGNGGPQKMQCYGGGVTSAIAEEEMIGEDDEYDELYGDLNIGEGFQFQLSQAPGPSSDGAVNEVIDKDEMYDELYGDLNIKEGFLQLHLSEASCPSANGAINTGVDPSKMLGKVADESAPSLNPNTSVLCGVAQMPPNLSNDINVNHQIISHDNPIWPTGDNGATILLVGELHWWTTDAEIESVSSKYGTVKEIKFFVEKATGKSKGYCQVEFYDSAAAAACKEGMNGYNFNGRACTVEFASPDTLWQMAVSYMNKSQVQPQFRYEPERRPMNERVKRWGCAKYPNEDPGRDYGRGSRVMRGTGLPGGRGPGYGDFTGPAFPRMMPPFQNVKAMGTPRVNPSIFGKGMSANRMGKMGSAGMDGPHSGMWNDGKWGAEDHRQKPRDSSYGGEKEGSQYGHRESSHYKFPKSYAASREKERASERDWSSNSNKRHGDERDHGRDRHDRERYDRKRYHREHRYREEKDDYHIHRRKYRDWDHKDDLDRGQASSRYRSRSRVMEVDHRSRSRDADYGKRSSYHRTRAF